MSFKETTIDIKEMTLVQLHDEYHKLMGRLRDVNKKIHELNEKSIK